MKLYKLVIVGFLLFFFLEQNEAYANVFAAHVRLEFDGTFPATVYYRLNEDATSVTAYLKSDTVVVRELAGVGDQLTAGHEASISWDGQLEDGTLATEGIYQVEMKAESDGHASWTIQSGGLEIDRKQPYIRGVAANKNNGSINFGRVYVIQQHTGLAGTGNYRPRGVWLYKNDLSFWGGSQETAYASGNFYSSLSEYCDISLWCSYFETETIESITDYEDSNGPFRITVDSADYVYVSTSLEDALGGITVGDADFGKESVFFLLDRLSTTRFSQDLNAEPIHFCCYAENIWKTDVLDSYQTYGVTRNHGLCSGMWIEGVGANRVLYVCDNLGWNGYMDQTWGHQKVVKFPVGDSVEKGLTYSENPTLVLPNSVSPDATEIKFDKNGNLFVGGAYNSWPGFTQYHSLQKFHPEGDAYVLDWERILPNEIHSMGIAYDPRSNRLAVTDLEAPGYIRIFNTETGDMDDEISSWVPALQNNDIEFDAAGNIIGANRANGQLIYIFPPDGANSFVTKCGYSFKVGENAGVFITGVNNQTLIEQPNHFTLEQNFPNPFNPTTTIKYSLSRPEHVNLKIYNSMGQVIKILVNHYQNSGDHSIEWDAKDDLDRSVSSGLYFYQLEAGEFSLSHKMALLK